MKIYVLPSISEKLPQGRYLWVALDVIRATSTIVTFFACGGKRIFVSASIREARRIKRENPETLLIGERGGVKIAGFDLDNSPTEIMENSPLIKGKHAVLTTTNGTRLLRKLLKNNKKVIIGSMINLDAVVNLVLNTLSVDSLDGIGIACAGKEGNFVSDDFYCAGVMVSRLRDFLGDVELNDAALVAESWALKSDAFDVFLNSASGKNAIIHGRYKDVEFCSKLNLFDIVPFAIDGGEVLLEDALLEKI